MHLTKNFVVFLFVSFFCNSTHAQDSTYIKDYSNKLLLRVYTITKFNSLSIENKAQDLELILLPNGNTNLGLGFNYKKIGLGIAFGLPPSDENQRKYGKTQRLDLQGSMYNRKIGADGFFQAYKGYYNSNPEDFVDWTSDFFPQIGNMKILSAGVIGFYLFNAHKYSYRAAFVRDEIQTKSAGSFLLGVFGNYDEATTDNGFVPSEFPDEVSKGFNIKAFSNVALGVSVGYAYNLVVKDKFVLGAAVIPGFGYQHVSTRNLENKVESNDQPAAQILNRLALGYEHRLFFINLTGSLNYRTIDLKPYDFNLSTGQLRFIIGKRFN